MGEQEITKDDSTVQVAAKTVNNLIFSKEHTVSGILLIVLGIMVYVTMSLLRMHFEKFDSFTRKVDMSNTIMIRNNDLMEESIKLMQKQIHITESNNKYLDRNKSIIERTTNQILDRNRIILENLQKMKEIIKK
ncbi:hypothetical protein [Candidatus Uabimicrobium sp. HlEnr_7]|uniref:hypothetical protein n=1 Tax=Candidatus Uabimicrobium helgolandensis TaxID=3095367 RepID=UPI0035583C9C